MKVIAKPLVWMLYAVGSVWFDLVWPHNPNRRWYGPYIYSWRSSTWLDTFFGLGMWRHDGMSSYFVGRGWPHVGKE